MTSDRIRIHFTDVFGVEPAVLDSYGAFDISLINDLPLFVDPFLLFNSKRPEYQQLHQDILRYLRFLRDVATEEEVGPELLKAWYMFPEIRQNWLGFSRVGNRGSGLGMDFARSLHESLRDVLSNFGNETITRSSHLEKLCLIKDGVGRDNISDFVTNLVQGHFLDYTQTFARNHVAPKQRRVFHVSRAGFDYKTRSWVSHEYELPEHEGDFVLLTPRDVLTRDETWISKEDLHYQFHRVLEAPPDDALRAQLNSYFRRQLPPKPRASHVREAKNATIRTFPALIDYYIRLQEDDGEKAVAVSEGRVRGVEQVFIERLRQLAADLAADTGFYLVRGDTYDEALQRVSFLKDVIEKKGGHRIFYDNKKCLVTRESDLQILFRLCWYGTRANVAPKSMVEFKLASNTQLRRYLERHEKASDTNNSLKVILAFTQADKVRMLKLLKGLELEGRPDVVVIDASLSNKSEVEHREVVTGELRVPSADVLLVVATEVERTAVLEAAEASTKRRFALIQGKRQAYYDLGEVKGTRVMVVQTMMGSGGPGGSLSTVIEAIRELGLGHHTGAPGFVIAVGIAFGVNPDKQSVGDVLVSKQLMNYELQRVGASGEVRPRGDRVTASTMLLQRVISACVVARFEEPKVGLLLSGEKLVDNLDYRESLRGFEAEAIGGEMEGSGLYAAAHDEGAHWVVVKAICDWADGNKGDDKKARQKLAATKAAEVVFATLEHGRLGQERVAR